jgi:hypothetical protein
VSGLFKAKPLSSAATEVLMQLFVTGPTWDGNIISKAGRGELVELGLAFHENGWGLVDAGRRSSSRQLGSC